MCGRVPNLRLIPMRFAATPLGMGYGETRFASPSKAFKVLYIAQTLITGVAETIVRDRFVGKAERRLTEEEIEAWGIAEVEANAHLPVLIFARPVRSNSAFARTWFAARSMGRGGGSARLSTRSLLPWMGSCILRG